MKRILTIGMLSFALLALIFGTTFATEIAVINTDEILEQSAPGKAG